MTKDKALKLAQDAGFWREHTNIWMCSSEDIEVFAELVRADERDACAKIAETPVGEYEVVVACGTEPSPYLIPRYLNWQDIVKAIRARGNT